MIDDAPDQVDAIDSSLGQIQDQIDELTVQRDGIQDELLTVAENDLTGYLDSTKLVELAYLDADVVDYGPDYGTVDYTTGGITDWRILDTTANVIYQYEGINWDNDPTIQQLIDDFAFGNDYITRPLTTGATYGLNPSISALNDAKSILTANKTQIEDSVDIFEGYA
jgi:hypothetical protein